MNTCPDCGHVSVFRSCPICAGRNTAIQWAKKKHPVKSSKPATFPIGSNGLEADKWRGALRLRKNGACVIVLSFAEVRRLAEIAEQNGGQA